MNGEQQPHDAQKTLTDLRDHLARHDKPIAFFFGAGTSCSVRVPAEGAGKTQPLIPAVPGLTAACKKDGAELGNKYAKAWASIEADCKEAKQDSHVESILSRLRMMINAIGKDDTLSGLKTDELKKLEESVRKTIARLVTPDLTGLPPDFPHRSFARWLAKTSRKACVEIFTVNYDVLVEHALSPSAFPSSTVSSEVISPSSIQTACAGPKRRREQIGLAYGRCMVPSHGGVSNRTVAVESSAARLTPPAK